MATIFGGASDKTSMTEAVISAAPRSRPSEPQTFAQLRHDQRATDRTGADCTKQDTIEACITAEQLTSDEREERPDGAGEGEENGSTQKHHMQRLVREGVTKACTERTEGVFLQRVVGVLCTRPADERRDDDEVTCDIGAIGNPCPKVARSRPPAAGLWIGRYWCRASPAPRRSSHPHA